LPGLAKFELTQGETVSSGFYYNAYVPNVITPQLIQPFFDYAFGFRRGTDAGQPPDNAGPRGDSVPVQRHSATQRTVGQP
jgi:phospholipid/cholesterol/gamma-HCH transport system substrate-binding protein